MNPDCSRRLWTVLAFVCLSTVSVRPAGAETQPKWELGAGAGAMSVPDYRGADEQRMYYLPLPYLIYRGDFLRIDRQKVQGLLARSERTVLDISLNASTPVNSGDNRARAGMPDLDPTLEIGPSLEYFLRAPSRGNPFVSLRLPLRAVLGIAKNLSHVRPLGWLTQPNINIDWLNTGPHRDWNYGASLGPLFATRTYHDYFYSVPAAYATPDRPAYSAPGGYSGLRLIATVSRRVDKYWFGAFFRYDNLRGVAFAGSPLLKQRNDLMAGFGMAYIFATSEEQVRIGAAP